MRTVCSHAIPKSKQATVPGYQFVKVEPAVLAGQPARQMTYKGMISGHVLMFAQVRSLAPCASFSAFDLAPGVLQHALPSLLRGIQLRPGQLPVALAHVPGHVRGLRHHAALDRSLNSALSCIFNKILVV